PQRSPPAVLSRLARRPPCAGIPQTPDPLLGARDSRHRCSPHTTRRYPARLRQPPRAPKPPRLHTTHDMPPPVPRPKPRPPGRRGARLHWLRRRVLDRKSTRLNSSHVKISYAVFCLKKKKNNDKR